jgi:hypothetical protein
VGLVEGPADRARWAQTQVSNYRTKFNTRDDNEAGLIEFIEGLGVNWFEGGPLDGWVNVLGWIPVEIKNPNGKNEYQPSQERFIALCIDRGWPVWTWRTEQDAIELINARRAGKAVRQAA